MYMILRKHFNIILFQIGLYSLFIILFFKYDTTINCFEWDWYDWDFWAWNREDWEDTLPIWVQELWWQPASFTTMPYTEAFKSFEMLDQIWDALNNQIDVKITFKGYLPYNDIRTISFNIVAREIEDPEIWITITDLKGIKTQLLLVSKDFINSVIQHWATFTNKDIISTFDEIASDYNFYHSLKLQYVLDTLLTNKKELIITVKGDNNQSIKVLVTKFDSLRSNLSILNKSGEVTKTILVYTDRLVDIFNIKTQAANIWHLPRINSFWILFTSIISNYFAYYILHNTIFIPIDPYYSILLPWEQDIAQVIYVLPLNMLDFGLWFYRDSLSWWVWGYPVNWWVEWWIIEWTYDTAREYQVKRIYEFFRWLLYARSDLGPFFPKPRA